MPVTYHGNGTYRSTTDGTEVRVKPLPRDIFKETGTLCEVHQQRCGFVCLSSTPADSLQHAKHCVAGGFGVREGSER
jgi:hypothetical protein